MIDLAIPTYPCEKVRRLREALDWTQQELAESIGVVRTLVTLWEKGIRTPSGPAAILLSQLEARTALEEKTPVHA